MWAKSFVEKELLNAINLAKEHYRAHREKSVIFFDELNTSPAVDLLKEIICDARLNGGHINDIIGRDFLQSNGLPPQADFRNILTFVAAINPYQKVSEVERKRFNRLGLRANGAVSMENDLTDLLYRVHPLPASLRHFVWNMGTMSSALEQKCIKEQVLLYLKDQKEADSLCLVLATSHQFMRSENSDCRFVSFRDVDHACKTF